MSEAFRPAKASQSDNCRVHRNFRLADLVTIMNGVCGSFSVFSSARYLATNDEDYLWSALLFPLAGLMFDFLDGKVARWRKSSSLLGQELDSLADLVRARNVISFCGGFLTGIGITRFLSASPQPSLPSSAACAPTSTPSS